MIPAHIDVPVEPTLTVAGRYRTLRLLGSVATTLLVLAMLAPASQGAVPLATDRGCRLSNCHGDPGHVRTLADGSEQMLTVNIDELRTSAHRTQACVDCHTDIVEIPHAVDLAPVDCENCHYEWNPYGAPNVFQFRGYQESIHGRRAAEGDESAPGCSTCHGHHNIRGHEDPTSSVNRLHVSGTCGGCHIEESKDFDRSIHGSDVLHGNPDVPTCTTCHGVHRILEPSDPESPVYATHIAETCSSCHAGVEIAARYDFSVMRVATYEQSFHGLASRYETTIVANCASCHGVHRILPEEDPESTIAPANLLDTCGQTDCHPDAGEEFSKGEIHLGVVDPQPFAVALVRRVYTVMIILVIGGMVVHNLLDLRAQVMSRRARNRPGEDPSANGDDSSR